jgi:hypothetical protein
MRSLYVDTNYSIRRETLGMNRLKGLVDSYRLATERPPSPGQILVHNQGTTTLGEFRGTLGFRARWATPGEEFVLCECGWRPGLGEHYQNAVGCFAHAR